jgi:hypothetical protein
MRSIFQRRQASQCSVDGRPPRCSFCDKPQREGTKLIAGLRGAFICEHCVRRCSAIISDSQVAGRPGLH